MINFQRMVFAPAAVAVLSFAMACTFTDSPAFAQDKAASDAAADEEPARPLRIICFGAHPDDVEFVCGGTGAKWAKLGHKVKFVSVTNGDIGHWQMAGGPLAQRRSAEAKRADEVLGVESEVLDIHDGELLPTLENRQKITRLIREWQADLVLSHRPWDYHPDHRYVGILVQDAAFMVTVPFFCPDTPPLKENPVFMYYADRFQKPYPFQADVAVDIDDTFDTKIRACHELASQVYEGGASGSEEYLLQVPEGDEARMQWLKDVRLAGLKTFATRYREALKRWYGDEHGGNVQQAEAFEICEYGRQPTPDELRKLFPFFD